MKNLWKTVAHSLYLCAALGTALAFVTPATAQERDRDQPNVLVILTDQQFADVMSCAGSEWVKTPAMDSIAKRGVRFPNAYVNYPVCMPER